MILNVFPTFAACPLTARGQLTSGLPSTSLTTDAKLGWILLYKHWISSAELEAMLDQQTQSGLKLGELLLHHSLISADQLAAALQEQYWRRNGYWVIQDRS